MDVNQEEFNSVKLRCQKMVEDMGERNSYNDKYEELFLMTWDEENEMKRKQENLRVTKSPDPRNKVIGALRLLVAGDPAFSVPEDKNEKNVVDIGDKLERWATVLWRNMGRVRQNPLHYDIVLSLLLYSEVHIGITKTSDLVKQAEGGDDAAMIRAKELELMTPYIADVWHPNEGYPEYGPTGLKAFHRKVKTTSGQIIDDYGDEAIKLLGSENRYAETELNIFWDNKIRYDWLTSSNDQALWFEEHKLGRIPVISMIGEGSLLFEDPEQQRQPFLYSIDKSELWKRQNLAMSVIYTLMYALGTNPQFIFTAQNPERELDVRWDTPGGVATILPGEEFKALNKQIIDPSLTQGLELAERLVAESSIYSQTLGEPLGSNAPFSMVAMLHQAGRLPLLMTQRKASWAIADVIKLCLQWWKKEGSKVKYEGRYGGLSADAIPDVFEMEAKLDIALPQDRLQQANTARILTDGEHPLVSRKYAREEYLGIGQPDKMVEDIWDETAADLRAKADFLMQEQQNMQKEQELLQMKMQVQGMQYGQGQFGPGYYPQEGPPQQGPPQQGPPGMPPGAQMGPSQEEMMGGNQGPLPGPNPAMPRSPLPVPPRANVEPIGD